ncbi:histidine--tRNA ligase [Bifidobacterium tibiigranuli]|uniref:histidine--tRNA ligase n=1 Tax=Bifidobacterium tibiigranuli TaxID=2172043 RepID=UPI0026F1DE8C|nr:histidine--tRNA ligase [Bifidobacterium tibiigranuli]MCI1649635.1 histidine--tRNA ligase [Bifidobacterium tibiigranuli]MCI2186501.1 histidine--tRNA ligase [Bifidobacterium tibiigranuli]MCI2203793.1 histidine--tRNA ligase [Bifidobacterium tibiigranuli]
MSKGASISGFPEWLPSERVVEQRVIDTLRRVFELNGFIGIETRAVEQGSSLLKKGETSKEIYLLSRLQEVGHESDTPIEDRLGLHFDLTVPLSRYVVEHSGALAFPFKRWQIQKVWRGERPQEGRFREFVQADIDVVGNGDLPLHYEVELPLVMVSALEELRAFGLPKATVHANNRKLSEGFYRGLGLSDIEGVLREIDKLDKVGADEVARLLVESCGANETQAKACLALAELTAANGTELAERFDALCESQAISHDSDAYALAREGLDTLAMIVDEAAKIRPGSVIADLKIARGLDYYTGSVYETFLDGADSLGSICSGGRYDNLATQGSKRYPGVGLSIGLSRLVSYMLHTAGAQASRVSPAVVLVAVWNEVDRAQSNAIANVLRARGIAADVAPKAVKLGKQIKYADKLGIPYVWFPAQVAQAAQGSEQNGETTTAANGETPGDEVRDIMSGEQQPADIKSWEPDTVYARQTVSLKA